MFEIYVETTSIPSLLAQHTILTWSKCIIKSFMSSEIIFEDYIMIGWRLKLGALVSHWDSLSTFVSTSLIMYSKPEQLISNLFSSTQSSTITFFFFFWWKLKHFSLNNFHSYYTGVWIQWYVIRRQRCPRVELSDIFDWIILFTERCLHVFQHW